MLGAEDVLVRGRQVARTGNNLTAPVAAAGGGWPGEQRDRIIARPLPWSGSELLIRRDCQARRLESSGGSTHGSRKGLAMSGATAGATIRPPAVAR